MPSERIQRRIDRLLDDAETAADQQDWPTVERLADEVLGLDAENEDAPALLAAAERRLGSQAGVAAAPSSDVKRPSSPPYTHRPTSPRTLRR